MEEVGRCHLKKIGMKILVAGSCLRHGESGQEEVQIPDPFTAAVPCYLVAVNLEDLFEAEEEGRQRLFCEAFQSTMVPFIHALQRFTEQLPPFGVADRCNH